MEINFNEILKDLDDENLSQPIIDDAGKESGREEITLGILSRSALLNLSQKDQNLEGIKKQERYLLALKIRKSEKDGLAVNLKSEEITLVKILIGEMYPPIFVGSAWPILDPE